MHRAANTRAEQALAHVRKRPGITIPQIAQAMDIQPNYLYRVMPRLAADGAVQRDGDGWRPAGRKSTATPTPATRPAARARPPKPEARSPRSAKRSQAPARDAASNGRTAAGATKSAVLAALAGGEAMTAGQVAAKSGLARPTVSTTLSKLAKSGQIR
jgi:predicted ArsR family transcriptional regulator